MSSSLPQLLYRDSANLLIADVVVDYHDLAPDHRTPTPLDNTTVTATAQVYAPDRSTTIGPVVPLLPEDDQPSNYFRGVLPASVDFGDYDYVVIKYVVDGGGDYSIRVRWIEAKVVDD